MQIGHRGEELGWPLRKGLDIFVTKISGVGLPGVHLGEAMSGPLHRVAARCPNSTLVTCFLRSSAEDFNDGIDCLRAFFWCVESRGTGGECRLCCL